MKRADRRMQKFLDVLSRWESRGLSMLQAGELLWMSERQFRRYRDRYAEEGWQGFAEACSERSGFADERALRGVGT
jgi:hypothetical protein